MTDTPEHSHVTDPPIPRDRDELIAALDGFVAGPKDPDVVYGKHTEQYDKTVEAIWRAGFVAAQYVAHEVDCNGDQFHLATGALFGNLAMITDPFVVVDLSRALDPDPAEQPVAMLQAVMDAQSTKEYLARAAAERLEDHEGPWPADDPTYQHLINLAAYDPAEPVPATGLHLVEDPDD